MYKSKEERIMLKPLVVPSADDFRESLKKAQAWAAENGYSESDIRGIIKEARKSEGCR